MLGSSSTTSSRASGSASLMPPFSLSSAVHVAILTGDPWWRLEPSWEVAGSIISIDVDTA
jgi:hypothetical protein